MSRVYEVLQAAAALQRSDSSVDPAAAQRPYVTTENGLHWMRDQETEELLIGASLGVDFSRVPVQRYLPVEIYLPADDRKALKDINLLVWNWLYAAGFNSQRPDNIEYGSLRLRVISRSHGRLTADDLRLIQLLLKVTLEDAFVSLNRSLDPRTGHASRDSAEEDKIRSEILKNRADAFKAVCDGAALLAKAISITAVGVSILVGTLKITKVDIPGLSVPKITVESVSPSRAVEEWAAPKGAAPSGRKPNMK